MFKYMEKKVIFCNKEQIRIRDGEKGQPVCLVPSITYLEMGYAGQAN